MALKIHHLHCGSYCPLHSRVVTKALFPADHFDCHCLLIEDQERLILVDTGLPEEINSKKLFIVGAQIKEEQTAKHQVEKLGFKAADITDIIVTHLDYDHVGGLKDFPNARIHLHAREFEFTKSFPQKFDYRFDPNLWKVPNEFVRYSEPGEGWMGFESIQMFSDLSSEILMIPLFGHSLGHTGVAIQFENKWLLHAGDAFFFKDDLSFNFSRKNILSEALQAFSAMDNSARINNLVALSKLYKADKCKIINSHDPNL